MEDQNSELAAWLLFAALELRPRLARRILECFGGPAAALEASSEALICVEGVTPEAASRIQTGARRKELAGWMEFAVRRSIYAIPFDDPSFPSLLNEIPDPPAVLFARGSVTAFSQPAVAMVGTRAATRYGLGVAEAMAKGLAGSGITVVSGGAVGIDAAAHRAAAGAGCTVAVLGCGLDVPYPSGNQALFEIVAQNGMMVSEFALGARPESWRFPARNRIISGLSRATVVVEAAEKSGAIITAGLAGNQGREVMAVPGPVNSPKSRGCHALIRDGATLVENAEQVLETLGWGVVEKAAAAPPTPELPMDQGVLLLALRDGQKHLDELTSECGLSSAQAGAAVTLLEMRGLIRRTPGNYYVRV